MYWLQYIQKGSTSTPQYPLVTQKEEEQRSLHQTPQPKQWELGVDSLRRSHLLWRVESLCQLLWNVEADWWEPGDSFRAQRGSRQLIDNPGNALSFCFHISSHMTEQADTTPGKMKSVLFGKTIGHSCSHETCIPVKDLFHWSLEGWGGWIFFPYSSYHECVNLYFLLYNVVSESDANWSPARSW